MKPSIARDRVYWTSGLVNGVVMTAYLYFVYRSIKSVLDDRADERRYISNVRSAGTPFGPVEHMRYFGAGRIECRNVWDHISK